VQVGDPAAGWPCERCDAIVPLDLAACPECGAAFLSRLAGDGGRHRTTGAQVGAGRLGALPRSVRMIGGIVIGVLLAVLVPVLLALLG
jgi:hypothetical protein